MLSSKWQIERIGLLDFWYYDEQEYSFRDGRMLLRGSNGSGKSVTMQSFIPLLLDGNMRPERLDPFGSRSRKMDNYMLEEGDDREERTGYLYMELKREGSEVYNTFGIGMRARKNKRLETWYFHISDNRRIGRDILLYKDKKTKMTCTKTELKYRIGEGGQVFDTQKEYERCVNEELFGFQSSAEYGELLNLLIQLRTPKLGKDFKPTVINEILSESLQTLSDEDLRPMSEAIENMDGIQTNLEALRDSIKAGDQIARIYKQYNEAVLSLKAEQYLGVFAEGKEKAKELAALSKEVKDLELDLSESEKRDQDLELEHSLLSKERHSLDESDAAKLKEREVKIASEIETEERGIKDKEKQIDGKCDRERELLSKERERQDALDLLRDDMDECLDRMRESVSELPFDDAVFFMDEFKEGIEEAFSFTAHERELKRYRDYVTEGIKRIEKADASALLLDKYQMELDGIREERNSAEREVFSYTEQLREIKSELCEAIAGWASLNTELKPDYTIISKLTRMVEQFFFGSAYTEITEVIDECRQDKAKEIFSQRLEAEAVLSAVEKERDEAKRELLSWQEKTDPEPVRSEAVLANRERLTKAGIPFTPFYKTIDFSEDLSEREANLLEEALLDMGLLDALVVPSSYKEEILRSGEGLCDHYLFGDGDSLKPNLNSLLSIESEDILTYQTISDILSKIGLESADGDSRILSDGSYQMGVLSATVTGNHVACFIGATARERYKARMILECQDKLALLEEKYIKATEALSIILSREEKLLAERKDFPSGEDLKLAAIDLHDKELSLERINKDMEALRVKQAAEEENFRDLSLKVQEICTKCHLNARMEIFANADRDLTSYASDLSELTRLHNSYLNGKETLETISNALMEISYDLDNLRYDLSRMEKSLKEKKGEHESLLKQLEMTDYEAIKERLDFLVKRLDEIPALRIDAAKKQERCENRIALKKEQIEDLKDKLSAVEDDLSLCADIFLSEYRLYLVYDKDVQSTDNVKALADLVLSMVSKKAGKADKNRLQERLQEVYHANKAQLAEYRPSVKTLFGEDTEDDRWERRRLLYQASFRGQTLDFSALLDALKAEADNLSALLDDKDRELFEDILANTISKKIRSRILGSRRWVSRMNGLMAAMDTSSGLKFTLKWKNKPAATEKELATGELVDLLLKDVEIMREEDIRRLSDHFRSKIHTARIMSEEKGNTLSFHTVMRDILDYRKWFEFKIEFEKTGEKRRELTDAAFFALSGGERAMAMYVPLFSSVAAKYDSAKKDAPRLLSLDEAFAGVDSTNIKDMFRLMVSFKFSFIINSQVLWADYETVPDIAIYQLLRPNNARFVTVIPYRWNGHVRTLDIEGRNDD